MATHGRVSQVCGLAAAVLLCVRWRSRHVVVQVQVVQGRQAGAHERSVDGLSPAQRANFVVCMQLQSRASARLLVLLSRLHASFKFSIHPTDSAQAMGKAEQRLQVLYGHAFSPMSIWSPWLSGAISSASHRCR